MVTCKLKLNVDLKGLKAGSIIDVELKNGVAVDHYWRNRIKDSIYDNCVSFVKNEKNNKNEKKEGIK